MKVRIAVAFVVLIVTNAVLAQEKMYPKAKISFEDFKYIVSEVEPHRAIRLINLDTFLKMSKEPRVNQTDFASKIACQ
jgi:hypothetical protein